MSSADHSDNLSIKRKLNQESAFTIIGIVGLIIAIIYGVYYYIEETPHCQFEDGGYTCDIFASSKEKQKMCIEDSLMNNPSYGTLGYNADTGKEYVLSKAEQKAMYNFIVEFCK